MSKVIFTVTHIYTKKITVIGEFSLILQHSTEY